jgi:hypothetical protein
VSWVKIDDRYAHHPKILAAGPLAMALDVAGMCHAARHETDGHLPTSSLLVAAPFLPKAKALAAAAKLVEVGRWEQVPGGWQIHDFLAYNPSAAQRKDARAQTEQRREADRQRKRNERARPPNVRADKKRTSADSPSTPHPQDRAPTARSVLPDPTAVRSDSRPASPPSATPSGDADSAGNPQPPLGLIRADADPGDPPPELIGAPNGALPPHVSAELDAALGAGWRRRIPSETDQDPREFEAKREQELIKFREKFAQELSEVEPEDQADESPP